MTLNVASCGRRIYIYKMSTQKRFLIGSDDTHSIANIPPLLSETMKCTPLRIVRANEADILSMEIEPWRSVGLFRWLGQRGLR